ncbi:uncharacterized protein LOC141852085 isoform X1 [Brevipalpus obovatus]|uniref:uncharacterized protein LOC141852085 isoform X1 n=1 Tax=Brevipalpus obovatus TaxID=246614 RepID=UPI003D9EC7AB
MMLKTVIFLLLMIPSNLAEDSTQTSLTTMLGNQKTEPIPMSVTDSEGNNASTISTTSITSATTINDSINITEFNSTESSGTIEPINTCEKSQDIFHPGCSPEIYLDNKWKTLEKCCNDGCFGCSNKPCPFCSDVMTKCIGGFRTDVKEILDHGIEAMMKLQTNITDESSNTTSEKPQDSDKPGDEKDGKPTSLTTEVPHIGTEATASKTSSEVPIESSEERISKRSGVSGEEFNPSIAKPSENKQNEATA